MGTLPTLGALHNLLVPFSTINHNILRGKTARKLSKHLYSGKGVDPVPLMSELHAIFSNSPHVGILELAHFQSEVGIFYIYHFSTSTGALFSRNNISW